MSNYDLFPEIVITGSDDCAWQGKAAIHEALEGALSGVQVLVVETYPGVEDEALELMEELFSPEVIVRSEDIFYDADELTARMKPFLTDDRVFGKIYPGVMEDFVDSERLTSAQEQVAREKDAGKRVLIYGVGAGLINSGELFIYCDMARWEIQLRMRAGATNFKQTNSDAPQLEKYKRGFFVEWRIADKRKRELFANVDFFLDTCESATPKLVEGEALRRAMAYACTRPFRLVPYFDPGVWGGHWMQEKLGLDPTQDNFAWAFDGVPEENSIFLRFGEVRLEFPSIDLVFFHPRELLGERVYARFGAEFPIRFDFLDTIGGQNLSLQVHPTVDYIRNNFGMAYTQDESYYILDATEDASVYLGLRNETNPEQMMAALQAAQDSGEHFDADAYINRFPAKKGDHFLIPAGTIHCSGAGAMVLEISATPYIFTFKMWDWDRLGLDGRPRPIHLEHAKHVINWSRRTDFCKRELASAIYEVASGDGWKEEHTGLHELEFIETRRFTASVPTEHDASKAFCMLNLVDGKAARIESPDGSFEPFEVHFAETFIVPSAAGRFSVVPLEGEVSFVKASVRI